MPILVGLGAPTAPQALPTTGLLAQFDAADTATHTPASGLWAPKSGSLGQNLKNVDSGGTTQTFSYGATQNGLSTIASPVTREFRWVNTSTTTYADFMLLIVGKITDASTNRLAGAYFSAGSNMGFGINSNSIFVTDGTNSWTLAKTGIGTNGAFTIAGYLWSTTYAPTCAALGSYNLTQDESLAPAALELRNVNSAFGGNLAAGGGSVIAGIDIGEILIYNTADYGQMVSAVRYLAERWGLS